MILISIEAFTITFAQVDPLNTAQYIADLESMIKPVITTATQWAFKVALGILGGQAFYALVVRVTKI